LNEFYIKEIDHYSRVGHYPSALDKMFFLQGGKRSAMVKGVFANFFKHSNVVEMMPGI